MSDKKILIDIKMIEMGLACESSGNKLARSLSTLSYKDKRRAMRKFRKTWRKICKEDPNISISVGLGKKNPTCSHKRNRKAWVRRKISQKISLE